MSTALDEETELESESELESVGVDSSARGRSRSRSQQNLTDSDSGVGVNAAGNAMHRTCLIDDSALDIRFCREKKKHFLFRTNVFSERSRKRWIPQNLLFNSACYFLMHICNAKPWNAQGIVSGKIKNISIMNFNIRI